MPSITTTSGRRSRPRRAAALGLIALSLLGLAACGDDDTSSDAGSGSGDKGSITIAHQAFAESEILAHLYGDALAGEGYDVKYQSFQDRGAIYTAIESGDVDLVPEYAATALEYLNKGAGEATPDITETAAKLDTALAAKDLAAGTASKAVDSNSLVVTKETADKDGLEKISDLKATLKLGGPQDCPTNAGCIPALKEKYGLDFTSTFVPLDPGGPLTVKALENGDIDVAVLFSTSSVIAVNGWKVLEDDKGIFNADNILPVGTKKLVDANKAVLDKVSATLTTANVTELAKQVEVDKDDADVAAKDFAKDNGL